MAYFDQVLHTNACQHYLTTGMCNILFDVRGFAKDHFSRLLSVSENAHNSGAQKNRLIEAVLFSTHNKSF